MNTIPPQIRRVLNISADESHVSATVSPSTTLMTAPRADADRANTVCPPRACAPPRLSGFGIQRAWRLSTKGKSELTRRLIRHSSTSHSLHKQSCSLRDVMRYRCYFRSERCDATPASRSVPVGEVGCDTSLRHGATVPFICSEDLDDFAAGSRLPKKISLRGICSSDLVHAVAARVQSTNGFHNVNLAKIASALGK